jgi:ficolin
MMITTIMLSNTLLIGAGSLADCEEDGKAKIVKELKSYQVSSDCTVKCSMYCEAGIPDEGIDLGLPRPSQITRDVPFSTLASTSGPQCSTATETVTVTATAAPTPSPVVPGFPADCMDALNKGLTLSGVYTIQPDSLLPFDVYCDMDTDGGGWTVFQRRQDGSVNFYQVWNSYINGFGQPSGEFWLGLEYLHRLTTSKRSHLRIDLKDFDNKTAYAYYSTFAIGNAASKYTLSVGGYSGTAGNALYPRHNNMKFSTPDQDNDVAHGENCAISYRGAWWYDACHGANLNGRYHYGGYHGSYADKVNWQPWRGYHYSLKFTEMKLRPAA